MNKEKIITYLKKIIALMVGLTIAHLGVTLFIQTGLGNDPYNVFIQGLYRTLDAATGWPILTHGRVHICVCAIIVLVLLFVDRSYIKLGTLLCMLFGGPIIDMFTMLLGGFINPENAFALRLVILVLGCVILAFGMTIVIKSDCGTGPNDLVSVVISDKSKKSFGIVRVCVDVSFALIGFLLAGTVGLGTVICAFVVGPVANFFMPVSQGLVNRFYNWHK